ncbi:MAG: hypothetical protein D3914_11450 [Candidatus Electrothrix sp. LOE2]|nr:hypothetical protein [Candidatus Electrothrix sp. LOE2]
MSSKVLRSFGVVLSLFLAALFGYFFNTIGEESRNAVRFLDIENDTIRTVISSKSIGADKLKIFWDNDKSPIDKIGAFVVKAYNFSDKDFENVVLRIKVETEGGGEPNVLYDDYYDDEKLSSSIKAESPVKEKDGSHVYKYTIPTVNRNIDYTPFFTARYFVKDETKLNTVASLVKKGLEEREFSLNHLKRGSILEQYSPLLFTIMLISGYILIIYMILKCGNKIDKNAKKVSVASLSTSLKKYNLESADDNEATNMAIDIYYQMNIERWDFLPKWYRLLFWFSKPNRAHLISELKCKKEE